MDRPLAGKVAVVAGATRGALASWELAREYGFSDVDGSQPDWGTYFREHVAAGENGQR